MFYSKSTSACVCWWAYPHLFISLYLCAYKCIYIVTCKNILLHINIYRIFLYVWCWTIHVHASSVTCMSIVWAYTSHYLFRWYSKKNMFRSSKLFLRKYFSRFLLYVREHWQMQKVFSKNYFPSTQMKCYCRVLTLVKWNLWNILALFFEIIWNVHFALLILKLCCSFVYAETSKQIRCYCHVLTSASFMLVTWNL